MKNQTQSATDKLLASLEANRNVIRALRTAIRLEKPSDQEQIAALALRISQCSSPRNHWIVKDAINHSTGEVFTATGQYWECGSKLCSNCIRRQMRRTRKKLLIAIELQKLNAGERYYFVTLTIPNPNRSLIITREIVNDAWRSFSRRKTFADLIRGGVKAEEFTLTKNGYHYHLHLIILSSFLRYNEIRRLWTESLDAAFTKHGIRYNIKTSDGLAIINIQRIKVNDKSIYEVCKYVTKSDSWTKMAASDLIDVARIQRWPRMFELFGCFKIQLIVHTKDLSVINTNFKLPYWRITVERIGLSRYSLRLINEVNNTIKHRAPTIAAKWPNSTVRDATSLFPF